MSRLSTWSFVVWMSWLAVVPQALAQAPQDDPAFKKVAALYQQGVDAKNRKSYAESTALFEKALGVKPLPAMLSSLPATLHYAVAANHALSGKTALAFAALERAMAAGYAEWEDALEDADLKTLRGQPQWAAQLARMKENARRARVYVVTSLQSAELGSAGLHTFEDVAAEHQRQLRERYGFAELVKGAASEWEAQQRLLTWVHNRWEHAGMDEPKKADALSILAEVEGGRRFRCVEYSVVSAQVFQAMGYPARVVSLKRDGASYGLGKGHVVTEVWNNSWQSWVVMDGQNNGTWQVDGRPLSSVEVREVRTTRPDALQFVLGPSQWRHKTQKPEEMKGEWVKYFEHISIPLRNTYPSTKSGPRISPLGANETVELLFQGMPPMLGELTRNHERAYPAMNTVHLRLDRPDGPAGTVEVTAIPTGGPWFHHLEATVNGEAASLQPAGPYTWVLKPGKNVLVVHAVNAMGMVGSPARVELEYFPPSK